MSLGASILVTVVINKPPHVNKPCSPQPPVKTNGPPQNGKCMNLFQLVVGYSKRRPRWCDIPY